MIYFLGGYPGAGKSTVAVQHAIYRYASQGRRVVANFPMDFAPICYRRNSHLSRAVVEVIPDRPTRADLDAIGLGGEHEHEAGLLIIDEAGTWLNARTWQGKDRDEIIDWLTQSRKRYWDIILIAQAPGMLDKQVRDAVCECVARIRRLDRKKVAGVSLPRIHFAIVRYGLEANAPVLERWIYTGKEAQKCFMSYRLFGADSTHYSVLPAQLTRWRYVKALHVRMVEAMEKSKAMLLAIPVGTAVLGLGLGIGLMLGVRQVEAMAPAAQTVAPAAAVVAPAAPAVDPRWRLVGVVKGAMGPTALITDGEARRYLTRLDAVSVTAHETQVLKDGRIYTTAPGEGASK